MNTLERNLQSVGMEAFVNYYDYFKKGYDANELEKIISEDWKMSALPTRVSNARKIFKNNWQIEALQIILKSRKNEVIKQKTRDILKKEIGG